MHNLRSKILELFQQAKNKSPEAETDLILLHAFQKEYPKIHSISDLKSLNPESTPYIEEDALGIAKERLKGAPLQHLLGTQYFYEHEYLVNESTLIPRPETEILVRSAIHWAEKKFKNIPFKFAELGIGSGVISCEILSHLPESTAIASEPTVLAIALARQNLTRILGDNIDRRITILEPENCSVGFEVFSDYAPFDLIVSNPPYLSVNDAIEDEVSNHEPHLALFPKVEGDYEQPNYFYENLILHSKKLLKEEGMVFIELAHERATDISKLFETAGFQTVNLIPDLTGRNRVLQASYTRGE